LLAAAESVTKFFASQCAEMEAVDAAAATAADGPVEGFDAHQSTVVL
jgi:hypothetical protein